MRNDLNHGHNHTSCLNMSLCLSHTKTKFDRDQQERGRQIKEGLNWMTKPKHMHKAIIGRVPINKCLGLCLLHLLFSSSSVTLMGVLLHPYLRWSDIIWHSNWNKCEFYNFCQLISPYPSPAHFCPSVTVILSALWNENINTQPSVCQIGYLRKNKWRSKI